MRKLIAIVLAVLLIYGISQHPHQWADVGEGAGNKVANVAEGVGTFFTDLFT
jgi:ABC-type cobalt transport system substrate-binding protein